MCKVLKRIIMFMLVMSMLVGLKPTTAKAVSTTVPRTASDDSDKYGTKGKLKVKTNITLSVPINPFAEDSAKSKGTSNTSYKKNGVNVERTFKLHSIEAKISGIGGGTITCPSGVQTSYTGSSATYETSTYDWDYAIYADILAIYGYRESHTVSYKLKKKGKGAVTVTMNAVVKA